MQVTCYTIVLPSDAFLMESKKTKKSRTLWLDFFTTKSHKIFFTKSHKGDPFTNSLLDTQISLLDTQISILDTQISILDTQISILDTQISLLDTPFFGYPRVALTLTRGYPHGTPWGVLQCGMN